MHTAKAPTELPELPRLLKKQQVPVRSKVLQHPQPRAPWPAQLNEPH